MITFSEPPIPFKPFQTVFSRCDTDPRSMEDLDLDLLIGVDGRCWSLLDRLRDVDTLKFDQPSPGLNSYPSGRE